MPAVSVAATVRDEAGRIGDFVEGLLAQTHAPDEIVVVDGGSTDGTWEELVRLAAREPTLRVDRFPGSTIAAGRNRAIALARGPWVALTDAGTVASPDWLARLCAATGDEGTVDVVSGFYAPGGTSLFERMLATVTQPHPDEVDPDRFLPSARSMLLRKEWWDRVGGFPEWLRHCEDLVFDLELKRRGARFAFAPDAEVRWEARPDLRGFFRQYLAYARGDGHALLWTRRHVARYGSYAAGLALLAAGRRSRAARLVLTAGVSAHLSRYARRLARRPPTGRPAELVRCASWLPAVVLVGDVAKMVGYPLGRFERWRWRGPEGLRRRLEEQG